jgi:Protein of unknown function (DUF1592)/Protein of unknown function (DUF1588)/Protein of unknown function (DUF1587)/Protein of unknown function (DUF1585)/Protein of unknown function (DUF1595)/Planctomycete cytochrome C
MRATLFTCVVVALAHLPVPAFAADNHQDITQFFTTYCIECHGSTKQKADRRYDQLALPLHNKTSLILLQDAIDQLNLGEMPPEKAKQPSREDTQRIIKQLTETVSAGRKTLASTGGKTVLRRLSKREYVNTISDLFAMDMRTFDPTASMPRDQLSHHLDNIGDTLQTSSYLLDQYVEAADKIVEKVFTAWEPTNENIWTFSGNELAHARRKDVNKHMAIYASPQASREGEGSYGIIEEFTDGVPADGFYDITVSVEAKNRINPYDPRMFEMDLEEPFRLGIVPGNKKVGNLDLRQPLEPLLSEMIIEDNLVEKHSARVWLDAGFTPRFTFINGMPEKLRVTKKIVANYPELFPQKAKLEQTNGFNEVNRMVERYGKMPHLRIYEVTIRGPVYETWPPLGHQRLFGGLGSRHDKNAVIKNFARRAFRRPVHDAEIDSIMQVMQQRVADGQSEEKALKDALKMMLSSASFIYLKEPTEKEPTENSASWLTNFAVASRLSYFLWSSMPDDELFALAERGELVQEKVLIAQVRRMLKDPKAARFASDFTNAWLNLRALGSMPPDRKEFAYYHAADLEKAMRKETQLFFRHLIDSNSSVMECITANYTFANRALARHYGVESAINPERAHEFHKIVFPDNRRGGLLGQASILTVSANGIETSPVIRGVWVMENILGITPSPPPDNVPPIDPDIRGATTIREVLKKHSESPACYECHRKIDPLGFGLENYDPVGAWRDTYSPKDTNKIDASGEISGAGRYANIAEYKQILASRDELFIRGLTEKMLSYACGRHMEALDRPRIDALIEALHKRGNGMRDLIELVVTSELFRQK